MDGLTCILDTNAISDYLRQFEPTTTRIKQAIRDGYILYLCKPADWRQAAHFWAEARNAGKQLSDVDLLIAALAYRLNATLVTSDNDFEALPVQHENWRNGI